MSDVTLDSSRRPTVVHQPATRTSTSMERVRFKALLCTLQPEHRVTSHRDFRRNDQPQITPTTANVDEEDYDTWQEDMRTAADEGQQLEDQAWKKKQNRNSY